ncbi:release factor glutamine methyltransferase [Polaribacter pacificus]|uniref:Release factor glutamine methyltransferase n=1 Tax=Polaribacter pacificus TaxID=1775173 RepID=A0A917I083_9FLAO|nr:peptide chain release factor N(5)-glutamine methyltransferase [Polaribacter pacificus]GGH00437.1 release factor glutamine methyltransferase [Polaribacter pacificus]
MQLNQFKQYLTSKLQEKYPSTEIESFFYLLIEETLGLKRIDIALQPAISIPDNVLSFLKSAVDRLEKQEPIQYIIGSTHFYDLIFKVSPNTLIPRPETEELVTWILETVSAKNEQQKNLQILDIGTGSGCIAVSLAKNLPNATIYALDVSQEALKIANQNAKDNQTNIHCIEADILNTQNLQSLFKGLTFDIIVSNPPYVRNLEKKEMQPNVLENEPHLALFVNDNEPLIFYKKIAQLAKQQLKEEGLLFFEINQYLGPQMLNLLQETGFENNLLKKDIFKNDRMTKSTVKSL